MRAGILRLNAAHGVPTTPTRGYHETITRFYMRWSATTWRAGGAAVGSWPERVTVCWRVTATASSRSATTRRTGSMSPEARAGWVEPDLLPLGTGSRQPREQVPPQLGQPPPDRAVVDPLPHPHHRAAQDLRVHRERRDHFLAQLLAQRLLDALAAAPRRPDAPASTPARTRLSLMSSRPGTRSRSRAAAAAARASPPPGGTARTPSARP